jgi:hypothetical protein
MSIIVDLLIWRDRENGLAFGVHQFLDAYLQPVLFCDREVETVNQPAVAALEIISAGIGHARQNNSPATPL